MSKVLRKYEWNSHVYFDVDIDGVKYEIKDAKDEKTAIEIAESIKASRLNEALIEPKMITVSDAVNVILSSKLDVIDKAKLSELNTKVAAAVSASAIEEKQK
jgi:predicted homoserine dehydrogenase-like protein